MKKKIIFPCAGIAIIIIAILVVWRINTYRSIDALMAEFEKAVNNSSIEELLKCYPEFQQAYLKRFLSEDSMKEFYDTVGDIAVSYDKITNFDLSVVKEVENEIQEKYNINIQLKDYQLIKISYHPDFGDSNLQIVKIKNKYYLYESGPQPAPIGYFREGYQRRK